MPRHAQDRVETLWSAKRGANARLLENSGQIREELAKDDGDTINIPLLMPLTGAGVTGDDWLESKKKLTCAAVCAKVKLLEIHKARRSASQFPLVYSKRFRVQSQFAEAIVYDRTGTTAFGGE